MSVKITDNSRKALDEMENRVPKILEMIGLKAQTYAKKLCPVGTVESTRKKGYRGGTLRNSITHRVDGDTLSVGSNVKYARYVELGTGPYFKPPPEWETFESEKGTGVGRAYIKPRPYIRPAIEDHKEEYEEMAKRVLKGG